MSLLLQHIIALSAVALCLGYAAWQGIQALRGRQSRVGSCCAKGCAATKAASDTSAAATPRVVYIPVSMLSRKGKA
jgi:hypothetical protein